MPALRIQLATNAAWEHALVLPLAPDASSRAAEWFAAASDNEEAAVEIVLDTARGPSMIGLRATGSQLATMRDATLALLGGREVASLAACAAHFAQAVHPSLFTPHAADAIILGAFNAWHSRGEAVLWQRVEGALDVERAAAAAMRSHLARSPSSEPLVVEVVTHTPLPHWVGVCASARPHELTEDGVAAAIRAALDGGDARAGCEDPVSPCASHPDLASGYVARVPRRRIHDI